MFLIETEKEFLNTFRPRDRKTVELPEGIQFPLFVRDYLAWIEPTGVRVFLVFKAPDDKSPTGIAFRRDQQGGALTARMCDWCHSHGSGAEIGLLTAEASSKRRVGVLLCLDLRCNEKLDSLADRAGRNSVESSRRLLERVARFAREGLGIGVSTTK